MAREHDENLLRALDDCCTFFVIGEAAHLTAANECRKFCPRGLGQWHDAERIGDGVCLTKFAKLMGDNIHYRPIIAYGEVDKAQRFEISTMDDFKDHLHDWIEREERFVEALDFVVTKIGTVNMELYQKVCEIVKEVQNEKFRAELVYNSFKFTKWNEHDISVKSKWIHDYFTDVYKPGDPIDFNIG